MTETEALEAMLTHHRALDDHVRSQAAAVARAVTDRAPYAPEVAEFSAYLADEVLPHALAEEHTIYQVAAARADLAGTIAEMLVEHQRLALAVEELGSVETGPDASERASEIATLFTSHVAKENEVLLPRLLEDDDVDLAQLLVQMQRLTKAGQEESSLEDDVSSREAEATPSQGRTDDVTT